MRGALLEQYLRVQAEHRDAILLFRLGEYVLVDYVAKKRRRA